MKRNRFERKQHISYRLIVWLCVIAMCLSPCSVLAADGTASADSAKTDAAIAAAEQTAVEDQKDPDTADPAETTASGEAASDRSAESAGDTESAVEAAQEEGSVSEDADLGEETGETDLGVQGEIIRTSDLDEYIELTQPDLDGASFDVNKNTGRISGTGDDISFDDTFDTSFDKVRGSRKKVTRAINNTEGYQVTGTRGNKIHVASDYSLGRVIVSGEVNDTYGAETAVIYDGKTLLTYDTEENTKAGYECLTEQFGADNVTLDNIIPLTDTSVKDMTPQEAGTEGTPSQEGGEQGEQPSDDSDIIFHGWGTKAMYLDYQMKKYEDSDRDVTIAVLDTGINEEHEIFSDTVISEDSMNFVDGAESYADDHGHGTMVSGIIAESTNSNVELMILKVLKKDEKGVAITTWETVEKAMEYAADRGANIINLSFGNAYSSTDCEKYDKILSGIAGMGILICASSGNVASDMGYVKEGRFYPADSPYTISVGAIRSDLQRASFSNYGDNLDFVAPGVDLELANYRDDAGYLEKQNGTSFSCPYVCAAAAFLLIADEENSPDTIYKQLEQISDDLGDEGKDRDYGNGMPNFLNDTSLEPVKITDTPIVEVTPKDYVYDGKVKRPTVTVTYEGRKLTSYDVTYLDDSPAVGTHRVEINLVGNYTGNTRITASFRILPKTVTMGKKDITLHGPSYNKATLRWSDAKSKVTYQVKYATNKSFKKAKTKSCSNNSLTITGLKHGKTYYIKIRVVKKVNGKKYYSPWSAMYWFVNGK